jgi:hypothetical protein
MVQNVKNELVEFYQLHFTKRPVEYIYKFKNKYYKDKQYYQEVDLNELDSYYLYKIYKENGTDKYNNTKYIVSGYLDGHDKKEYKETLYNTKIYINDNPEVDIDETEDFFLKDFGEINKIQIGLGVMLTAAYQIRTITYNLEVDTTIPLSDPQLLINLHNKKAELQTAQDDFNNLIDQLDKGDIDSNTYEQEEPAKKQLVEQTYLEYITLLDRALQIYKEDNVITI